MTMAEPLAVDEAGAPVAVLKTVSLTYGKTRALDAVDLAIPSGCMVGLVGPDGVGKSSLLSLIAGAHAVQTGRIEVLGGNIANAGHRSVTCPRIAYMPQGLGKNLYPTLSVFENVEFFGQLFGQARSERERRIGALLKSAGLAPSTSEANRLIEGGGVRVDGAVVSDKGLKLPAGTFVVQVGKRKFARVTLG